MHDRDQRRGRARSPARTSCRTRSATARRGPCPARRRAGASQLDAAALADRAGHRCSGRSGPGGSVYGSSTPNFTRNGAAIAAEDVADDDANEIIESLSSAEPADRQLGRDLPAIFARSPSRAPEGSRCRSPGWRPEQSCHLCLLGCRSSRAMGPARGPGKPVRPQRLYVTPAPHRVYDVSRSGLDAGPDFVRPFSSRTGRFAASGVHAGLLSLLRRDGRRSCGERGETAAGLRERDHVTDRLGARQQRHDPVPQPKAIPPGPVRAGLERLEQKAELLLGLVPRGSP